EGLIFLLFARCPRETRLSMRDPHALPICHAAWLKNQMKGRCPAAAIRFRALVASLGLDDHHSDAWRQASAAGGAERHRLDVGSIGSGAEAHRRARSHA